MTAKKTSKPNEKRWRYSKGAGTRYFYQNDRRGYGHVFKMSSGSGYWAVTYNADKCFPRLRDAKAFVEAEVNKKRKRAAKKVKP